MTQSLRAIPLWFLLVLLSGCASMPMPETNTERLAATEISYKQVLDTATLYVEEGRLSDSQTASLAKSFDNYEAARNLAILAIQANDDGAFENQNTAMLTILTALRSLVAEVE